MTEVPKSLLYSERDLANMFIAVLVFKSASIMSPKRWTKPGENSPEPLPVVKESPRAVYRSTMFFPPLLNVDTLMYAAEKRLATYVYPIFLEICKAASFTFSVK